MNEEMLAGMRDAMSLLQRDGPMAATAKIQETLGRFMPTGGGVGYAAAPPVAGTALPGLGMGTAQSAGALSGLVPDLLARLGLDTGLPGAGFGLPTGLPPAAAPRDDGATAAGQFLADSFTNEAGTRAYKLYVPTAYRGQPLPLLVMLHGAGQSADDCAAGTGFNDIAEAQSYLVLYPAQSLSANAARSWNWFNPSDQQRDQGEPSIIAGMTRAVMAEYHVDPAQVYCAGMSAGGAMAVVMGATYPDLYAAVGTHSAMPYGAATDFSSAFAAMNGAATPTATACLKGVPIIVFHGDRDAMVNPRNSDHILAQSLTASATAEIRRGRAGAGHAYTQTVHKGPAGRVLAEQWLVHGAGHAWSGGSRRGSFTDDQGPNAAQEMMRFFSAQAQPAT